jgi:serine protease AprX
MAKKQVIAYFMHEEEMNEAQRRIPGGESTESYVVGEIEEADIPALQSKGLVVQEVQAPDELETPGMMFESASARRGARRRDPGTVGARRDRAPSVNEMAGAAGPEFYLVQLQGPLLERWRQLLDSQGVILLEHVPHNAYTARLTPAQVQQVRGLPFVRGLRQYGPADTGPFMAFESAAPPVGAPKREMLTFDVRLHREEDRQQVLDWLASRNVAVAGASGRKLRIYALEDSSIPDEVANRAEVAQVEQYVAPTLHNDVARGLMGIDAVVGNPGSGLNLTGQGQIVAVADTGLDDTHPDFAGRIMGVVALGRPGDSSDPHGHGTHVAGSVLGDGAASNGQIRGAAPAAQLFFQSLLDAQGGLGGLPLDLGDLFEEAYQNGARIHNNSWGAATQSMYTINSIEVDEYVATRRDMLIVISAGNEGDGANPRNAQQGFVDWLSIGSPASAKNALVVGASRTSRTSGGLSGHTYGSVWPNNYPFPPSRDAQVSGDPEALAAFSSRGPCDDRRVKPDLVAPGTDIVSAKSSRAPLRNFWGPFPGNGRYAFMGGTSMSAPLVAGAAALVREYFIQAGIAHPSAALLKATLINGTRWLGAADAVADHVDCPNYHQGFGCVDLRRTLPHPAEPALRLEVVDPWETPGLQFVRTGQRFRFRFGLGGNLPLRICLAWTDLPARGTQNSLGFLLQGPGNRRWVANSGLHGAITTPDPDNNVQIVSIESPPAGDYLLQVFARNLLKAPQDYALVVSGDLTTGLAQV